MKRYLQNYRITITTDNGLVHSEESAYPSFFSAMDSTLDKSGITLGSFKEGQSASMGLTIAVECLLNRPKPRAPRRPPEVIAAEKAAKLVNQQAWAERRRKEEEEAARIRQQKCKRIMHQIDHAFKTGESGSEPVARYITCHCDAPAEFIYVSVPLAPGAAVLGENTITDAVCAQHNHAANQLARQWGYKHVAQIVPCSRLEFFYTGVRLISVKSEKP